MWVADLAMKVPSHLHLHCFNKQLSTPFPQSNIAAAEWFTEFYNGFIWYGEIVLFGFIIPAIQKYQIEIVLLTFYTMFSMCLGVYVCTCLPHHGFEWNV